MRREIFRVMVWRGGIDLWIRRERVSGFFSRGGFGEERNVDKGGVVSGMNKLGVSGEVGVVSRSEK